MDIQWMSMGKTFQQVSKQKCEVCLIFSYSYKPLRNVLFDLYRCLNYPFSGGITDLEGLYGWLWVTDRHFCGQI